MLVVVSSTLSTQVTAMAMMMHAALLRVKALLLEAVALAPTLALMMMMMSSQWPHQPACRQSLVTCRPGHQAAVLSPHGEDSSSSSTTLTGLAYGRQRPKQRSGAAQTHTHSLHHTMHGSHTSARPVPFPPSTHSIIAAAHRVHVVASVDHINAAMLLDQRQRQTANWVHRCLHTPPTDKHTHSHSHSPPFPLSAVA